jgi:hypothetical protein
MQMPERTELDRLAAARPPLLDRTELVIDSAAEEQILRQILGTAPGSRRRRTAAARPARHAHDGRSIRRDWLQAVHRPVTAIAAAAAVVAVAGAAVLVRSVVDHQNSPGRTAVARPAAAAARLPSPRIMAARAEAAVAAVSRTGILYVRTTYMPGSTVDGTAFLETWTSGTSDREKLFSAAGGLLSDVSAVIADGQRVRRFVDYRTRTWQTDSIALRQFGADPFASYTIAEMFGPMQTVKLPKVPGNNGPDDPRRTITAVTIQGKPMILVTFIYPRPFGGSGAGEVLPVLGSKEELPATAGNADAAATKMIWIDATSYLPVRAEIATATGRLLGSETYTWLSDSAANRALLAPAPVPAGFRLTQDPAH